jgi:glutamine amidotransferase
MISIIDYEGGNLTSVLRAVNHLGYDAVITREEKIIDESDRLIFPGVGAAGASMDVLNQTGLTDIVKQQTGEKKKPFLAICIGIQILFETSEEDNQDCLGILPGCVKRFPENPELKIPQIGWNQVYQVKDHPVFRGVPNESEFYFVNSYYSIPSDPELTIGETEYGIRFTSAVARENVIATQFHLEKSGPVGLQMLKNFCEWKAE